MILDYLIAWFFQLLSWILAPFPDQAGLPNVAGNLTTIMSNLGALNYFLPISETFAVVIACLLLFPLFFGISITTWIYAQIRGSSPR
jgi:hypothetical protein